MPVSLQVIPLISIHALLAESDPLGLPATSLAHRISIHALLAESDPTAGILRFNPFISIHALLAESDAVTTVVVGPSSDFYPRSPCGERRSTALA